jgi:hypothetical protein
MEKRSGLGIVHSMKPLKEGRLGCAPRPLDLRRVLQRTVRIEWRRRGAAESVGYKSNPALEISQIEIII